MAKNNGIRYQWIKFSDLSVDQLYDLLVLREKVFILEQKVKCEELDDLDKKAYHLLVTLEHDLVGYARVLPVDVYAKGVVSFGRLIVASDFRGHGLGRQIMKEVLRFIKDNHPDSPIKFSAQLYLKNFYENFGFKAVGDEYDEGGIPHIAMVS